MAVHESRYHPAYEVLDDVLPRACGKRRVGVVVVEPLKCYVDGSGSAGNDDEAHGEPMLVLAGVYGTESEWSWFEQEWNAVLANEGIDAFGMSDLAHASRGFRPRDNERDRRILKRLGELVQANLYGRYSVAVPDSAFAEVSREYDMASAFGSQYLTALHRLVDKIHMTMNRMPWSDDTSFVQVVLEKGDAGQRHVPDYIDTLDGWRVGIEVKAKRQYWTDKSPYWLRPFDMADALAYEQRLEYQRSIKASAGAAMKPVRKSLSAVAWPRFNFDDKSASVSGFHAPFHEFMDADRLRLMCKQRGVLHR